MLLEELSVGSVTSVGRITKFYEHGIHVGYGKCFNYEDFEAYEVNRDILKSMGFKGSSDDNTYSLENENGDFEYCFHTNQFYLWLNNCPVVPLNNVKTVHQFQNFYLSFTGTVLDFDIKGLGIYYGK